MAKRCAPRNTCGMKQGIFNPFFQNGAQWYGSGGGVSRHAFGIIGDSNADGAATIITTCAADTLYLWNGSTTTEITTQSVANDSPTLGSIWQPFATAYKANTGSPVFLINGSRGGSNASALGAGSGFSWSTTGTLYDLFKAKVASGLAASGISQLTAIIVNLGVNDVRGAQSLATITTGFNSLFTRLNTDYPGVPVLVIQVGRKEDTLLNSALYEVRELLIDLANTYTNVHMCSSALTFALLSGYEADGLHYNQLTQQAIGSQLANWFTNSAYSKWGRSVISSLFDVPSNARKTLIDNFISSQVTSGNYFRMDGLHVFKTGTENNIYFDWSFIGYGVKRTSTFTANDSIATDGVAGYFDTSYIQNHLTKRSLRTNLFMGVKVKTRVTAGTAYLFGNFNGTNIVGANSNGTNVRYLINDATFSNGTEVTFANNSLYSVGRTAGTKRLIKNKTQDATAAVAVAANIDNFNVTIGAINSSGTKATFMSASYEYYFVSEHDSFDIGNFYDNIEIMIAGW
jgi:lysophospholipase L1-like esterase